ncbi:MAG: glycosyltransferase [Cyanobacteriota bacterium]|nr:glycosyltransferase [Cyanobacteriota bacterium]
MSQSVRIAFLARFLSGGLEQVILNTLKGLSQYPNIHLDLVVHSADDIDVSCLPKGVRIIDLKTPVDARLLSSLKLIAPLVRYLRQEKPQVLFSHLIYVNVIAVIARAIARKLPSLFLVEHNLLFANSNKSDEPQSQLLVKMMGWLYPKANGVIAVSGGMARALEKRLHWHKGTVATIYNPVIDEHLLAQAQLSPQHPWLEANQPPVFLAAGRLTAAKDFSTLIQAFALARQRVPGIRLLILGEGPQRAKLEAMAQELGVDSEIDFPGFVKNPYSYMSRARVFVLSSRWEGLPTVLIEAIACGCQVVATDCPHGPKEILESGKYGRLVPVGDIEALAEAMQSVLNDPIAEDRLQERSLDFSIKSAVAQYLKLLNLIPNNTETTD